MITAIYVSHRTKYTWFKEHYSIHLGEWYLNTHQTSNKKGQQAHFTDSLTLQIDQPQNNLDMTVHNVNTIATTQDKILTQNEASYTPSVCPSTMSMSITSTTKANSAKEQRMDTLPKMMQIFIQQQTAPSTNNTRTKSQKAHNGVTTKWRQWIYLCYYTCCANLSHNSDKCKRLMKHSNHDQFPGTTKEIPRRQ